MREEIGVLGGQHGLDQHLGQMGVGHHGPVFRADLAYQIAVAIEHTCELGRPIVTNAT